MGYHCSDMYQDPFSAVTGLAILGAAFASVIGMFLLNGLPRLYHPVFRGKTFDRASADGFFVAVEARGRYMKMPLDAITDGDFDQRDWFADPRQAPGSIEL